jgi:hypothetical protein
MRSTNRPELVSTPRDTTTMFGLVVTFKVGA